MSRKRKTKAVALHPKSSRSNRLAFAPLKKRNFAAVNSPFTNFSNPNTSRTPTPASQVGATYLQELRGLARAEARSHPMVKSYLRLMKDGVIGSKGPRLQINVKQKAFKKYAKRIEAEFEKWTNNPKAFDKGMNMTAREFWRLAVTQKGIDGEIFIIWHGSGSEGLQQELVDPQRIPTWSGNTLADQLMGIVVGEGGEPLEYQITERPMKASAWNSSYWPTGSRLMTVPAHRVLHFRDLSEIDAYRGWPPITQVLENLNLIRQFGLAALANAQLSASRVGQLKRTMEGPTGDWTPEDDTINYNELDADQVQMINLPPGVTYESITGAFPHQAYSPFMKTNMEIVASSLGIAPHHLTGDYAGINFSSGRLAEIRTADTIIGEQKNFEERVLRPTYDVWLMHRLEKDGFGFGALGTEQYDLFKNHTWQHQAWHVADPLSEVKAHAAALQAGLQSRSGILRAMGLDPEQVAEERKMDVRLFGEPIPSAPGSAPPTTDKDSDENKSSNALEDGVDDNANE